MWSYITGNASCFICETSATSADNLLDTWIPINLFKCLRAIVPLPYRWEAKRRGSIRSSLIGLETAGAGSGWSWDLEELVAMTAGTLPCFLCLFPPLANWINQQPIYQHRLTLNHLTSSQCGRSTYKGCDPLAMKNHNLATLDLEHWGFCQVAILKSYCKTIVIIMF